MAVARALCPVVIGREAELSELEDALLDALRGNGGVVLLSGDAGMGKSRLAAELSERGESLGCSVLFGGCSEADLALPYLPFLEAIGNHLSRADVPALRERLGPAAAELAQLFPQLGAPAAAQADSAGKLRLFEAVVAILSDAARDQGLLLLVEDIHWADPSTRELLDYLTRRLRAERVLLLATMRSDELHRKHPLLPTIQGWRRAGMVRAVELQALDLDGVGSMVQAILDQKDAVSTDFRSFLRDRTEGNPFVLEEMLKAAIDRGDVYREANGWGRKDITELKLPETVRDTILLRIERLGEDERESLSAAAVVGRAFDLAILVAVTGREEDAVLEALHTCVLQQLLEEEDSRAGTYRFRHALTREAVYDDLLQPQRKRLHARVAEALRGRPGTRNVDLAHHLLSAGLTEEGAELCVAAAEDAFAALAFSDAAELYSRAADNHAGVERARLLYLAASALWNGEQPDQARRQLEEAIEIHSGADAAAEVAEWRLLLGRCYWEVQRSDLARAEFEQARDVLEPLGPSGPLALAYVRLSGLEVFDERDEQGLAYALKAIDIARAAGARLEEAWAEIFAGTALSSLGQITAATARLEAAYNVCIAEGFRFQAYNAVYNSTVQLISFGLGHAADAWLARFSGDMVARGFLESLHFAEQGRLGEAITSAQRALDIAQQGGFGKMAFRARCALSRALAEADRAADARAALPALSDRIDAQDSTTDTGARLRTALAENDAAGALEEARTVPTEACALAYPADSVAEVALAEPQWLADFLAQCPVVGETRETPRWKSAQALLALAEGRSPEARDELSNAIDAFTAEGYPLPGWHLQRFLARAEVALGDAAAARERLERTTAEATAAGALLAARLARETAAELGFELATSTAPAPEVELQGVGEKLVTILFADVRGYTSFTSQTAPAGLADKIGSLQRWAAAEVQKHRGVVDKFAGDAIMATFNANGASVDHAEHALEAGLAIRDKAALLGIPVGIGIAVGPAVVGHLANGGNLSVLGEVTNLAARLQASAAAGEVRLSEEAHRRVRERLAARGVTADKLELELKGFAEPVPAFSLS